MVNTQFIPQNTKIFILVLLRLIRDVGKRFLENSLLVHIKKFSLLGHICSPFHVLFWIAIKSFFCPFAELVELHGPYSTHHIFRSCKGLVNGTGLWVLKLFGQIARRHCSAFSHCINSVWIIEQSQPDRLLFLGNGLLLGNEGLHVGVCLGGLGLCFLLGFGGRI